MKKRTAFGLICAIFLVLLLTAVILSAVAVQRYFYPPTDNVLDELWVEMWHLQWGLIKSERLWADHRGTADLDYDLGQFMGVRVPDLNLSVGISGDTLYFIFFDPDGYYDNGNERTKTVYYRYDTKTDTLYGEGAESRITEAVLPYYFFWCEKAEQKSHYSANSLGSLTYVYEEHVSLR